MSMGRVDFLIPLPPSVNRLWRVGKNKAVYKSDVYRSWLNIVTPSIIAQCYGGKVCGKYKLTVRAVRPDKRKRDLDNLIKAISDALELTAVIEGDHLCEHLEMQWVEADYECYVTVESIRDGQEKQL